MVQISVSWISVLYCYVICNKNNRPSKEIWTKLNLKLTMTEKAGKVLILKLLAWIQSHTRGPARALMIKRLLTNKSKNKLSLTLYKVKIITHNKRKEKSLNLILIKTGIRKKDLEVSTRKYLRKITKLT